MKLRHVIISAMLADIVACSSGKITDGTTTNPTPTDTTKAPPTTVQRSSLLIQVNVDVADAVVATAAGVTSKSLTVHLTRVGPGFTPLDAVTGNDGTVRFDNLLEGVYHVSVDRKLTAAEQSRLAPGDKEVSLFAGGTEVIVRPPDNPGRIVPLIASRRGSVIISEMFFYNAPLTTNLGYGLGDYIEVYNNGDTTAYLDGMLLFRTPLNLHGGWKEYPCDSYNTALRNDSTGIETGLIHQFPGHGTDYPILPGQAKVVAMDALNHDAASPGQNQVDLSNAEFEQIGSSADIDNPFSANMINFLAGTGLFGRGYPMNAANIAYGLASRAAVSRISTVQIVQTYGTYPLLGTTTDISRIPAENVLDIIATGYSNDQPGSGNNTSAVTCTPFMAPAFDRARTNLVNSRQSMAVARKSLGFLPDGREILQRTRTSDRDFELARPLRRSLAK